MRRWIDSTDVILLDRDNKNKYPFSYMCVCVWCIMKRVRQKKIAAIQSPWYWNEFLPEMQHEIVGHLDYYSRQALSYTNKSYMRRQWGDTTFDQTTQRHCHRLGIEGHENYIQWQWKMYEENTEDIIRLHPMTYILAGLAKREDMGLLGRFCQEFQRTLTECHAQHYGETLFCSALICANSPKSLQWILDHEPSYVETMYNNICLNHVTWLYGRNELFPPNVAMMSTLRRGFFSPVRSAFDHAGEFDPTYNLCLKWCKHLLDGAISRNQLEFLYASAALDPGLTWYMNEPSHIYVTLREVIDYDFGDPGGYVNETKSLLYLLEKRGLSLPHDLITGMIPSLKNMAWLLTAPKDPAHHAVLTLFQEVVRREPLFAPILIDDIFQNTG